MNVLWIQADQMRADCAGFMGHPLVQTPNLDALASRGMVFGNAFAQSPICTPSRTCLFTGRYVHAHGAWWNGVPMSGERSLLPEILRQAGYHTGLIGKLHFNPQDRSYGFNHRELHEERLPTELSAYDRFLEAQLKLGGTRETDLFAGHGSAPYTEWSRRAARVGLCKLPEHVEETRWCADRACAFLREQTDSPFFLYASFIRPHSPYNPLPDFAALYEDADISPPPFSREEWDLAPPRIRATARSWGWDKLGPEDFSEVRRHYYALCSQADHNVGRILQALDAQGLADSTLVVFASDHGDFLGEHGLLYKEHLWDGALHVPLIIYDPRRKDNALIYSGLVETIDVMPTLLALLGLPASTEIQGKSLTPIMENPEWITYDDLKRVRYAKGVIKPKGKMYYIEEVPEKFNLEEAIRMHYKLFPLCKAMFIETNPIPVKTSMMLLGRLNGRFRLPLCPLREKNLPALQKALKEYGLME